MGSDRRQTVGLGASGLRIVSLERLTYEAALQSLATSATATAKKNLHIPQRLRNRSGWRWFKMLPLS